MVPATRNQRIVNQTPLILPYGSDLGIMEVGVRNPASPESRLFGHEKKQPAEPARGRVRMVQPIEGIVYADPQAVYEFLVSKGYPVKNTASSTLKWARVHVSRTKEQGITDLLRLHPDRDLIIKACGATTSAESSSFTGDEQIDGTKLKDIPNISVKDLETKIINWGNQVSMGTVNKDLGEEFIKKAKASIKDRKDPDWWTFKMEKKNALSFGIIALLVIVILIGLFRKK